MIKRNIYINFCKINSKKEEGKTFDSFILNVDTYIGNQKLRYQTFIKTMEVISLLGCCPTEYGKYYLLKEVEVG